MKRLIAAGIITALLALAGDRFARAAEPVAPPAAEGSGTAAGVKHTVCKGETLWGLSGRYYGDPFQWGRIYSANRDRISDPDRIYPSEEISIPELAVTENPAALPEPVAPADLSGAAEEPVSGAESGNASVPAEAAAPVSLLSPGASPYLQDVSLLSEEAPKAQQEWTGNSPKIVPVNWKGDGMIVSKLLEEDNAMADGLTEIGDRVLIKTAVPAAFSPGDLLTSFIKGAPAYDTRTGAELGVKLQKTGILKVVSVSGKKIVARVLSAATSVDKGQHIAR